MGSFSVSVEVSLIAFAGMIAIHAIGALGVGTSQKWIAVLASLGLVGAVAVMPLVWALPVLYLVVMWRPPFHAYAMWTLGYYFQGLVVVLWLFMALPATIDPKSDGERSSRSVVYHSMPLDNLVTTLCALLAFCVSYGAVVAIHKHREYWTVGVGRMVASVLLVSALQRFVGACASRMRAYEDAVFAFVFLVGGWGLLAASVQYRLPTADTRRQPVLQGPGVCAAAVTGTVVSFVMDGVPQELEIYQLVFTCLAWLSCAGMFAGYLKRYRWAHRETHNPIATAFSHWLVNF